MKQKLLGLMIIFLCGWQITSGQQPTAPAPTPTHEAGDVKSAFSDVYSAFTKWEPQGYSNATFNPIKIGDDNVLEITGLGWSAIALGGRNVADKGYVHLDVFAPLTDGVATLGIGFAGFSGGEKYADYITLTPGQWQSVDISLSDIQGYDFSATAIFRIRKTGGKTLYIDNMYFYGKAGSIPDPDPDPDPDPEPDPDPVPEGAPTVSAPTPAHAANDVKSAFSDAYTAFTKWETQSYSTAKFQSIKLGNDNIQMITNLGWSAIALGGRDVSDKKYFHIDVFAPTTDGVETLGLGFAGWSGGEKYADYITLTPGQWQSIDIPLSDFGDYNFAGTAVFRIRKTGGKILYIDNMYFYGDSPVVPPVIPGKPITPAPTPTHEASDVKSAFSDAYTSFLKWEPQNYSVATFNNIQIEGDNVLEITGMDWTAIALGGKDVSDKGYIHLDIYSPSDGVETFNVGFALWSAGQVYEPDYRTLKHGEWISIDIPLIDFSGYDFTSVQIMRFRKTGKGTLYVDNVYFYGEPGEPTPPTPEFPPIQDKTDGELPDINIPLLGVNLASASGGSVPGRFGYDYLYPKFEDLYYFKAKGIRFLRIPFRGVRMQHELMGELDFNEEKSDIKALEAVVREAERLGMWVMLDMHDYCERTIDGTKYVIGETENYTAEHFADMWKKLATVFKDYKNIWGYDLMNEPKDINIDILVNNYQTAINAIREVDTNAQIVIEGRKYASAKEWPTASDKLKDLVDPFNKIVYEAHSYFDSDNSGRYQYAYNNEVTNENVYKNRLDPFINWLKENEKKGMLGEYGVPYNGAKNSDERYMTLIDNVFSYLKEHQLTSTYWCGGAMYDAYQLTIQPDKSTQYGNYAIEKSTMKVMDKYIKDFGNKPSMNKTVKVKNTSVVYPTCFDSVLNVTSLDTIDTISIYNLMGQKISEITVDAVQIVLNTVSFSKGNYLLKLSMEDGTAATYKVTKL